MATVVAILILLAVIIFIKQQKIIRVPLITNIENEEKMCDFMRKLDGVCVNDKEDNIWPVALMIDNNSDAWPQAGLSQAQLVYNTLVEGGTTRIMAVFANTEEVKKIGPIRSARPYYLEWAKGLDALYAHSGGSAEALEKINNLGLKDLNEISYLGTIYFYRDDRKLAPHNLFTDSEKIRAARKYFNLDTQTPVYQSWQFSAKAANYMESAQQIKIDYSAGVLFDIKYIYNTSTEKYLRYQNEEPQIDANNQEQLEVKNIVIQFVPEEIHLDAADRLKMDVLGEGEAWIFNNGKMMRGFWKKESSIQRTFYYNNNWQEIVFQQGNIWIEMVPGNREVNVE